MASDISIESGPIAQRLKALAGTVPLSVLLVDDDELERTFLGDQLQDAGFKVRQAANGREALSILEATPIPVLVVDWRMPVMDGIELTENVRARGMADIYVIMLTSREGNDELERGYLAGVDDYLTKKVHQTELLARINTAFSTYALRRELRSVRETLNAARDELLKQKTGS